MKIKELSNNDKPRERLIEKGVNCLNDNELLALLLGSGTKNKDVMTLANEILRVYPFNKLKDLSYENLIKITGIKMAKACSIIATFEIVKRSLMIEEKKIYLESSKEIYKYILNEIILEKEEVLIVLYLDTKLKLLKKSKFYNFSPNSIMIPLRKIIKECMDLNAVNCVFIHNHPSGDVEPSESDKISTWNVIEILNSIDVELIDHLVVSSSDYFSFADNGILSADNEYNYLR